MKYKNVKKKSLFPFILISLLCLLSIKAFAYDFSKYNFIPPFIASGDAPSVLFVCDTSGSMDHFAYAKRYTGDQYDPDTIYYGYFDSYAYYRYVKCEDNGDSYARSGFFEENTSGWTDGNGDFHGSYNGDEDGVDNVDTGGSGTGVGNFEWSGNFLNYISMRRMDVLKRVLIGGRRAPDNFGNIIDNAPAGHDTGAAVNPLDYLVVGDNSYYGSRSTNCQDIKCQLPPGPTVNEPNKPTASHFLTPYGTGAGPVTLYYETWENNKCGSSNLYPFYLKFNMAGISDSPSAAKGDRRKLLALKLPDENGDGHPDQPKGIVQRTGAGVRFGVMRFNSDNQGGEVLVPVGNTDHLCTPISSCGSACASYGPGSDNIDDNFLMGGVIKAINDLDADGNTPLGETLATAVLYFQQNSPYYHDPGDFTTSKEWDPYFFNKDMDADCAVASDEGEYSVCSKGYVIILTDGEPTSDYSYPGWVPNYTDGGNDGTRRIDDVARYSHITDLRPSDETHDGKDYFFSSIDNTLNIYPVFTFGQGGNLLKSTARNGGFIDKNGDNRPNTESEENAASENDKEWDFDGDGLPDNYFEAKSGSDIEASILSALSDILKRAASGTAASIISGSRQGAGALYQALFFPEMQEPGGINSVAWTGYLQAMFLDKYGNICEDTDDDKKLDIPGDRIVQLYWSDIDNATKVRFYTSRLPNGLPDPDSLVSVGTNSICDLKPVWEAGERLGELSDSAVTNQRSYSSTGGRYIFTWLDNNNNGTVDNGEVIDFTAANAVQLETYFALPPSTDTDYIPGSDLISWIRGKDLPSYRARQIDFYGSGQNTWRLGDIVYSTPTVAGPPAESLDLIYNDSSYRQFYYSNRNRRNVVYVGANDGMLHAFNAGFYDENNQEFKTALSGKTAYALGQELWAYIPFDLLPHLQALPQKDYDPVHGNHVCFVDLKPRIADIRFADGTWHTILICGMRFGGGEVTIDTDGDTIDDETLRSAYFALDVTDPEVPPALLWSFNDTHGTAPAGSNHLGFTTSYPAVVNTYDAGGAIKSFAIFGSGPTTLNPVYDQLNQNYPVKSNQQGRFYAIDIESGVEKLIDIETSPGSYAKHLGENYSYFGDPVSIDLNFKVEELSSKTCYASELAYVGMTYDDDNNCCDTVTAAKGKIYRLKTMQPDGSPETDPDNWKMTLLCDVDKPVAAAPNVSIASVKGKASDYRAYIDTLNADTESYIPIIYFGTGEFWFAQDKKDRSQQSFYGIIEPVSIESDGSSGYRYKFTWNDINTNNLMDVSNTKVYTNGWVDMNGDGFISSWTTPPADPVSFNNWPDDPPNFKAWISHLMKVDMEDPGKDHFSRYHGWKSDLVYSAERVAGQSAVLGGVVTYTSYLPSDDVCVTKGESFLYALHHLTGTAYFEPVLGVNSNDTVTEDGETYELSVKTVELGTGMGLTPTLHGGYSKDVAKAFIQTSSGEIKEFNINTVFDVLPPGVHMRWWREEFN